MLKIIFLVSSLSLFFSSYAFAHGDLHEQIQRISKKMEQTPDDASLYLRRGQLYKHHNKLDSAKYDLIKARQLNPELIITDLLLGEVFSKNKLPTTALKYINNFLKIKSADPDGLIIRAGIYRQLNNELAAKKDLEAVFIALKDPAPKHYIAIAESTLRVTENNFEAAIDWLEKGQIRFGFDIVLNGLKESKNNSFQTLNNQYVTNPTVKVYPNPLARTQWLNIELLGFEQEVQIAIFDVMGRIVQAFSASNNLTSGIYFLHVADQTNLETVRVVIQE